MKEVRKLARQTMTYGLGTIIPRFLNYGIMTFFYTRFFKEAEYGVITELYAWMVFMQIVLTYGMETGFFRFSQKNEDFERVYSTSLISLFVTSVFFVVLVFVFIEPVAAVMNYRNNHDYIKMFAVILALDAVCAIPFARLRKENRPVLFSIIKIVNVIVTIAVVLFLLISAPGVYEKSDGWFRKIYNPDFRIGYVFVANIAGSAVTLVLLLPYILRARLKFYSEIWIKMLGYSFPLLIAGLSGAVNDTLDKVILRRMIGEENGLATVGVYGAGYKVAVLIALFIQMFRFAAEPFFFERAKHEDARETYRNVMKYFVIVMLLFYITMNLYLQGIQYIIDKDFREALGVVPIVSMGYLLYGIYVNHSIWYKLSDMTRFGVYIALIGAIVTVVINVLLIPAYGYMASAWAHIASYGTMIVVSFIFARKRYRIDYDMKSLLPYFGIATAMVLFGIYFPYPGLLSELAINTMLILLFIYYAQRKDRIIYILLGKGQ